MSMTGTEIASALRKRINDTAGSDPTDVELVDTINLYTKEIWNNRVDALLDSSGQPRALTLIAALGDTLDLDDGFRLDLLNGIAGEVLMWKGRNKEDQNRAQAYLSMFRQSIIGR